MSVPGGELSGQMEQNYTGPKTGASWQVEEQHEASVWGARLGNEIREVEGPDQIGPCVTLGVPLSRRKSH